MGMVLYLRRANAGDIERMREKPEELDTFIFEEGVEGVDLIDFDKAWQALHFLLTGEAFGLGQPLGIIADETAFEAKDENGFGGFSVVQPERMARFAEALRELNDDTIKARFDPTAMVAADIYLADAFSDVGTDEALEYILQGLPPLRRFASSCEEAGDGALRVLA